MVGYSKSCNVFAMVGRRLNSPASMSILMNCKAEMLASLTHFEKEIPRVDSMLRVSLARGMMLVEDSPKLLRA